ncbi:hypothetical protein [Xanthomonas sp. NCPPB 2632]|uniref:hypothetical protein n=1 Tax=Xanthomonas sp. NCPPB 2632 TaxID=3240912 RepID=UPI0035152624
MPRSTWQLETDVLITPQGRKIPLSQILNWAMARHDGRMNIDTDKWHGWRIVQQYLVPPGRTMANGGLHINAIRSLVFYEERDKRVRRTEADA